MAKRKTSPKAAKLLKPRWITGKAAKVWKQVVAEMEAIGTLAASDGNAIARYCELTCRWAAAAEFIRKYGESYPLKDSEGKVKCFAPFPQVAISNKLSAELRQLERQFALTPAARAKLNVGIRKTPQIASRNRMPAATVPFELAK